MISMFERCSSLKELNLSNFNTNNVTNMESMFYECSSLKELNLSNFNTNNVTDMSRRAKVPDGERRDRRKDRLQVPKHRYADTSRHAPHAEMPRSGLSRDYRREGKRR